MTRRESSFAVAFTVLFLPPAVAGARTVGVQPYHILPKARCLPGPIRSPLAEDSRLCLASALFPNARPYKPLHTCYGPTGSPYLAPSPICPIDLTLQHRRTCVHPRGSRYTAPIAVPRAHRHRLRGHKYPHPMGSRVRAPTAICLEDLPGLRDYRCVRPRGSPYDVPIAAPPTYRSRLLRYKC